MIAEGKIIYLVNSPKDGDTKPNGSKVSEILRGAQNERILWKFRRTMTAGCISDLIFLRRFLLIAYRLWKLYFHRRFFRMSHVPLFLEWGFIRFNEDVSPDGKITLYHKSRMMRMGRNYPNGYGWCLFCHGTKRRTCCVQSRMKSRGGVLNRKGFAFDGKKLRK